MLSGMDDLDSKGEYFADFRLGEKIGSGGMGSIYQAMQMSLQRPCAVKILSAAESSDTERKRFLKEARLVCSLDHPNIVKVFSVGFDNLQRPYIAMELLKGQSLDKTLDNRRIGIEEFRRIFIQVADAIEYAHAKNIIHRDLKPGNIFLVEQAEDEPRVVKLLDFGIARILNSEESSTQKLTRTGHMLGTPTYMSPEQSRNADLDCRSDIYSFGIVMFEALTGKIPFHAESALELMYKHSNEKVDPNKLPAESSYKDLNACILKCLEKNPADRFQSASELKVSIESATKNLLDLPSMEGRRKVNGLLRVIAALSLIIIASTFLFAQHQKSKSVSQLKADVLTDYKSEKTATLLQLATNAQKKALSRLRANDNEGSRKLWEQAKSYYRRTIEVGSIKHKELEKEFVRRAGQQCEKLSESMKNEHNAIHNAEFQLAAMYKMEGDIDNECKFLKLVIEHSPHNLDLISQPARELALILATKGKASEGIKTLEALQPEFEREEKDAARKNAKTQDVFFLQEACNLKTMGDICLQENDLTAARKYFQRGLDVYAAMNFKTSPACYAEMIIGLARATGNKSSINRGYKSAYNELISAPIGTPEEYDYAVEVTTKCAKYFETIDPAQASICYRSASTEFKRTLGGYTMGQKSAGPVAVLLKEGCGFENDRGDFGACQKLLENAEDSGRELSAGFPVIAEAKFANGVCNFLQNRNQLAENNFIEVVNTVNPLGDAKERAFIMLGRLHYKQGQSTEATAFFDKALKSKSDLSVLQSRKFLQDAIPEYIELLKAQKREKEAVNLEQIVAKFKT